MTVKLAHPADIPPSPAPAFPDPDPGFAHLAAVFSRWFTPGQVADLAVTWKKHWAAGS